MVQEHDVRLWSAIIAPVVGVGAGGGDIAVFRRLRGLRYRSSRSIVAIMGDKSPKSMRKQAGQKQARTNEDNKKQQAATLAKQVPAKRK